MKCGYGPCNNPVRINESCGPKPKYCCSQHGKAKRESRSQVKLATVEAAQERKNIAAKQFATINCLHWRACMSAAARERREVKCLDCEDIQIKKDAYRMEMGTEMFGVDVERHSMNLPE